MRRPSPLRYRPLCLVAGALAVGCGPEAGPNEARVETRVDSGGVEIVSLAVGREGAPVFTVIAPEPELRLGSPTGPPEEEFGAVRDVIRLRDGGLAVLDGLSAEVRVFDAEGRFRGSLGSRGDGPGEFQAPVTVAELEGDTLAVFDPRPRRITRFAPDGSLGRITTLSDEQAFTADARFRPDGRLVVQSHYTTDPDGAPPPFGSINLVRDTVVLRLFDAEGQVADTLDIVPSADDIVSIERTAGGISILKRPPIFGRTNLFALGDDGLWSAPNDRFELRLREVPTGRLLRVIRAPGLETPATPATADAIVQRAMDESGTPQQRSWLQSWAELSPLPETEPAYDLLKLDGGGRLWVRDWSPTGSAARWWVFDSDGALLGSVDFPPGTRLTSIRCGAAIGIQRDELEVDYVVRYAVPESPEC